MTIENDLSDIRRVATSASATLGMTTGASHGRFLLNVLVSALHRCDPSSNLGVDIVIKPKYATRGGESWRPYVQ